MCVSSMSSVSVSCLAFVNKCVMIVVLVITVRNLFGVLRCAMVVMLGVNLMSGLWFFMVIIFIFRNLTDLYLDIH